MPELANQLRHFYFSAHTVAIDFTDNIALRYLKV